MKALKGTATKQPVVVSSQSVPDEAEQIADDP